MSAQIFVAFGVGVSVGALGLLALCALLMRREETP